MRLMNLMSFMDRVMSFFLLLSFDISIVEAVRRMNVPMKTEESDRTMATLSPRLISEFWLRTKMVPVLYSFELLSISMAKRLCLLSGNLILFQFRVSRLLPFSRLDSLEYGIEFGVSSSISWSASL